MSHTTTLKQKVEMRMIGELNDALVEIARTLTNGKVIVGKSNSLLSWQNGRITYTDRNGAYVATIDSDHRKECDPVHRRIELGYRQNCVKLQLKRMGYSVKRSESKVEENRIHMHARRL